jgi:hypothetical protein
VSQVTWSIEIAGLLIIPINDGFYCILVVNLLADDLNHINDTDFFYAFTALGFVLVPENMPQFGFIEFCPFWGRLR